ncbi:hypothetical protein LG3211_5284 [Lysobacter gummosus]|nr:hypothetical protein LG3211_5284 [Lysobacter gummosus]
MDNYGASLALRAENRHFGWETRNSKKRSRPNKSGGFVRERCRYMMQPA